MVDFLLYAASLEASVATRSKISIQVRIEILETLSLGRKKPTIDEGVKDRHSTVRDTGVGVDLLQNYFESHQLK